MFTAHPLIGAMHAVHGIPPVLCTCPHHNKYRETDVAYALIVSPRNRGNRVEICG